MKVFLIYFGLRLEDTRYNPLATILVIPPVYGNNVVDWLTEVSCSVHHKTRTLNLLDFERLHKIGEAFKLFDGGKARKIHKALVIEIGYSSSEIEIAAEEI